MRFYIYCALAIAIIVCFVASCESDAMKRCEEVNSFPVCHKAFNP